MVVLAFPEGASESEMLDQIQAAYNDPSVTDVSLSQEEVNNEKVLSAITDLMEATFSGRRWNSISYGFGQDDDDPESCKACESACDKMAEWYENFRQRMGLEENQMSGEVNSSTWHRLDGGGGHNGYGSYQFCDLSLTDVDMSPLHLACRDGRLQDLVSLLELEENQDIDLNLNRATQNYGWTPVHLASHNGHDKVLEFLIEKGANLDVFNKEGSTPLHVAIAKQHAKVARILLENGVDANAKNRRDGNTPLQVEMTAKIAKLESMWESESDGLSFSDFDTVRLLVAKGADINVHPPQEEDSQGSHCENASLLHQASYFRMNLQVMELFLDLGANVNASDNHEGRTPLHVASEWGGVDKVRLLIAHGADVNLQDKNGNTPLMDACTNTQNDMFETIKLLVEKGASVKITNNNNESALHLVCRLSYVQLEVVEYLVDVGADIFVTTNAGDNLLHAACGGNDTNLDKVRYLVEHGVDINAKNTQGETPLHTVVGDYYQFDDNHNLVAYLIEMGADINASTNKGKTPLELALYQQGGGSGKPISARLLVDRGANGCSDNAILERLAALEAERLAALEAEGAWDNSAY